jgi:hypothetical protein
LAPFAVIADRPHHANSPELLGERQQLVVMGVGHLDCGPLLGLALLAATGDGDRQQRGGEQAAGRHRPCAFCPAA